MAGLSRRQLIGASAGAAIAAVPISALSAGGSVAAAASRASGDGLEQLDLDARGPVMFCVHDVSTGEVSVLHGTDEVIVRDRQLVNRILRLANARQAI